jgi:SAM-dependent methyltransferase
VADFADFDARGYPTLAPREGYARWSRGYERDVEDEMDIALLERLRTPQWSRFDAAADLGCGSGRTGAWLAQRGVDEIDGVDLTPEMLDLARERGVHRSLSEGDARASGLESGAYDLVIASLIDEHLPDPRPLHEEAWRLARPGGSWVIVGLHPNFIINAGMPTHFDDEDGEPIAIETHVHLISEQVAAGLACGWQLAELCERVVDGRWLERKPQWERWRGHPVSVAYASRKPDRLGP